MLWNTFCKLSRETVGSTFNWKGAFSIEFGIFEFSLVSTLIRTLQMALSINDSSYNISFIIIAIFTIYLSLAVGLIILESSTVNITVGFGKDALAFTWI